MGSIKGKQVEKIGYKVSLSQRVRAAIKPGNVTLKRAHGRRSQTKEGQGFSVPCAGLITPGCLRSSHFGFSERKPKWEGNELAPRVRPKKCPFQVSLTGQFTHPPAAVLAAKGSQMPQILENCPQLKGLALVNLTPSEPMASD